MCEGTQPANTARTAWTIFPAVSATRYVGSLVRHEFYLSDSCSGAVHPSRTLLKEQIASILVDVLVITYATINFVILASTFSFLPKAADESFMIRVINCTAVKLSST